MSAHPGPLSRKDTFLRRNNTIKIYCGTCRSWYYIEVIILDEDACPGPVYARNVSAPHYTDNARDDDKVEKSRNNAV
ncbi:hypothetical protein QTP88_016797 [Uroleucon formosanum]